MKSLHLALLVALSACAERAAFSPTENIVANAHGGQPAAAYQIRAQPGASPYASIQVWSRGAEQKSDRTNVDIGVSVRNTGAAPITLAPEALQLEAYSNNGAPLPAPRLTNIYAPNLTIPAGTARDVHLRFAIPRAVSPDDIGGLRLRWAVIHDGDQRYVQFTEFRRVEETAYVGYYDPMFGYYDPFWYPHPYAYRVPVTRVIVHDHIRDHRGIRTTRR